LPPRSIVSENSNGKPIDEIGTDRVVDVLALLNPANLVLLAWNGEEPIPVLLPCPNIGETVEIEEPVVPPELKLPVPAAGACLPQPPALRLSWKPWPPAPQPPIRSSSCLALKPVVVVRFQEGAEFGFPNVDVELKPVVGWLAVFQALAPPVAGVELVVQVDMIERSVSQFCEVTGRRFGRRQISVSKRRTVQSIFEGP
jgi:hypothetical protein